jgi:hypothetical protein
MPMTRRVILFVLLTLMVASVASANHSWGGYHWARKSNPFTLKLYDNLDPVWESYLSKAVTDWNKSTVLDYNVIVNTPLSSDRKCSSTTGAVEICNTTYGQNGWLGIAGISLSGGHIVKGYTKLNDTYFAMARYNTPAYRQFVTCQEIGHDFGLDHQDETFANANLGSCMDYTDDPDGGAGGASSTDPANTSPNQHDYDQISTIYAHTDSTNSYSLMSGLQLATEAHLLPVVGADFDEGNEPWEWGTPVRWDGQGKANTFYMDLGNGNARVTHVLWAPEVERGNSTNARD